MKARLVQFVVAVLVVALSGVARGAGPDFDRIVAPLLSERCLACHGGNKPKGGLDLSRRRSAMEGGDQGAAIVPGKPDASVLWEYVNGGKMPPKKPLSAAEKEVLRAWIVAGAGWGSDPIDP
ncbi:MAG: c-type cytochrome domain-containing protein, partial [Gemmataceae bacterium]